MQGCHRNACVQRRCVSYDMEFDRASGWLVHAWVTVRSSGISRADLTHPTDLPNLTKRRDVNLKTVIQRALFTKK